MAWTTPWAWFAGKVPTVAELTQLSDDVRWASGPRQTTPPGSPADGDEWYMDMGTGVLQRMKYNSGSASAFKWENAGGGAMLLTEVAAAETRSNTAYGDLATIGPDVVCPRSGDYEVYWSLVGSIGSGAASLVSVQIWDVTGAVQVDAFSFTLNGAGVGTMASRITRINNLTAGNTYRLRYATTAAVTNTYSRRLLGMRPIRVS